MKYQHLIVIAIFYPMTLQAGSAAPAIYSESAAVPPAVLEKLSGRAGIKWDKFRRTPPKFSGRLFNGSRWVITNITVTFFPVEEVVSYEQVRPVDKDKREALTQSCTSGLTSNVSSGKGSTYEARPLTEAKFTCPDVYAPDRLNYHWYITSAQGYKK